MAFIFASILLSVNFGECDFRLLPISGPYNIGYREFRAKVMKNEVSVYYPIDLKADFDSKLLSKNVPWLRHGDKTFQGILNASAPFGTKKTVPAWLMRPLKSVMLDCVMNE